MAIWLNRAGSKGEFETKFLNDKKIYLTWSIVDRDLRELKNIDDLRSWHQEHYNSSVKASTNYSSQIWKFLNSMKIGDLVILPSKIKSTVHLGKITSECLFEPNALDQYKHYRTIEWLKIDAPRSDFEQDILYSFGAFSTIAQISRNESESRIKNYLKTGKKQIFSKEILNDETLKNTDELNQIDLEDELNRKIHDYIERKFKGYEMQKLIAAILEAKGYATIVPVKGPDNGVDILAGKGKDDFGFLSPKIIVQVKTQDSQISNDEINKLLGALDQHKAEFGILVSWSGFKSSFEKNKISNYFKIRLWDSRDVIQELIQNYENVDEDIKVKIPLKRIWALNVEE
jgi:restriction system protein